MCRCVVDRSFTFLFSLLSSLLSLLSLLSLKARAFNRQAMSEKEAQAEAVATTPAPASVAEEGVSAKGQDGADQPAQEPLQEREQGNSDVAVEASKTEASGDTATVLVPTQAELDQLQPGVFPDLNVRSGSGRKTRGVGARERGSVCVRVCVCACVCVCVCARAGACLALFCFLPVSSLAWPSTPT